MKICNSKATDVNIQPYNTKKAEPEVSELGKQNKETVKNEHFDVRQKKSNVSKEVLQKAVESANRAIGNMHAEAKFSIHEGTGDICVKIIDKRNDEVIREIPPEKILDLVAKLWELAGIFIDEKR